MENYEELETGRLYPSTCLDTALSTQSDLSNTTILWCQNSRIESLITSELRTLYLFLPEKVFAEMSSTIWAEYSVIINSISLPCVEDFW